jgi:hypothetical protein
MPTSAADPQARNELAHDRHDRQREREEQGLRPDSTELDHHTGADEEDGRHDGDDRADDFREVVRRLAAEWLDVNLVQDEAGGKCADDGRQPSSPRDAREKQAEADGDRSQDVGCAELRSHPEDTWHDVSAKEECPDEEACGKADDDAEIHGPRNGAELCDAGGLGAGHRIEVFQDARGDAHARRAQGCADEQVKRKGRVRE